MVLRVMPCWSADSFGAIFVTGGIRGNARIEQSGSNVHVHLSITPDEQLTHWQIYELPVDFSIDPKLRCGPDHVGRFLGHSGSSGERIRGVTVASLLMHSVVLVINNERITCGTIAQVSLTYNFAFTEFKSGLFGRLYFAQFAGKNIVLLATSAFTGHGGIV